MSALSMVQRSSKSLPLYQEKLDLLKSLLKGSGSLAVLFVDVSGFSKIEMIFGKELYGQVLEELIDLITGMRGQEIRSHDLITQYSAQGEQFLVFLEQKREDRGFWTTDLESLALRVSAYLNQHFFKVVHPYLKTRPRIAVGYAIVIFNPLIQEERQIYKLLEDARQMASYQQFRSLMRNKEKIQELIIKEAIQTHFQPIVRLKDYELLGFEALSRGPTGTEYETPYSLFEAATEAGLAFELDRLCRRKALENAQTVRLDRKLFVNCLPAAVHDPELKSEPLAQFLHLVGLSPNQLVMEISERDAIANYDLFRKAVTHYSKLGIAIAMDDAGAGHSSLETVAELRPHFLKLDISLVQGIDRNPVKQELIHAVLALADSIEGKVIAEGIETSGELDRLLELGVPYGQGFLIGRPAPTPVQPARRG